jgi:heptosyltransferase-1
MARRILIVRLGSLGDLVHTLPAVTALRRAFPAAEIDWLVDAPHREFLELVPVISSLVVRATRSGGWLMWCGLRPRRYDMAVDFQGLVKSAALARLSGETSRGFAFPAVRESLAVPFYTDPIVSEERTRRAEESLLAGVLTSVPRSSFRSPRCLDSAASSPPTLDRCPSIPVPPGRTRWPPDRLGAVALVAGAEGYVGGAVGTWRAGRR